MFCSNCGENLIAPNQKFCHNCGTAVLVTSDATDYKTESIKNETKPEIIYVPVKRQEQLQKGIPGKYSKFCLGLASGSIFIGIVSFITGYGYFMTYYYSSYSNITMLAVSIVILLLRVGGLIMGVYSKVYSSKAVILEPYNDIEKTGSILGILGIITNAIGLYLSILGPYSFLHFPYW